MTFDEIKKIDRGPDFEMYSDNIVDYSACGPSFDIYYYITLLALYIRKFDEIYGTNICLMADLESLFCCVGDYEGEEDFFEKIFTYEYEAMDCFIRTAERYGFELCIYSYLNEDSEIIEADNPEKALSERLLTEVETADEMWMKIFKDCCEELVQYAFYLETGTIIIIRNHEMGAYKQICSKYHEILKDQLKEEQREIERTIRNLSYPVLYYHILESGYVDEYYYMCLVIGCDGYNSCGFIQLNISWLINCFILKQLFLDFREKLAAILANMKGVARDENRK